MILKSIINCPECSFKKEETMPVDSCLFFYECTNCKLILKPMKEDCCVFCSYGDTKCPPKQEQCCLKNNIMFPNIFFLEVLERVVQ